MLGADYEHPILLGITLVTFGAAIVGAALTMGRTKSLQDSLDLMGKANEELRRIIVDLTNRLLGNGKKEK